MRKIIISTIVLIVCIAIVSAFQPFPESCVGYATLNGAPAPYGTPITAEVYGAGEVVGSTTVQYPDGGYSLDIIFDDPDTPEDEGANDGDKLTWKINGIDCSTPAPGTDTATPGGINNNFNLIATSEDNPPSITVIHPNGGESIPLGTQVQVSACATDDAAVMSVTFSYSSNGGSDWNSIGAGTRVSGTDKNGIWDRTWNTNGLGAGLNYLIRAVADDGTSPIEDQSDSTFSLTCTPPSALTLNDPGTTDTDGSYMVSWSSVSGATSYALEEDTSGSFGSPTVVYSGSGTSKYITGRSDGTYYYRVNACNACGCGGWSNVEGIKVEIPSENIPPIASFTYSPLNPVVDQMVAFDLSSSCDLDGEITHYRLDFGDESGAEGPGLIGTIGHAYSSAVSYIVTLTVTDDYGATGTETKTVTIVTGSKGDLNGDNHITPADATIALQLAATGGWDANADVNHDSRITSLDALMILHAVAGAIAL